MRSLSLSKGPSDNLSKRSQHIFRYNQKEARRVTKKAFFLILPD